MKKFLDFFLTRIIIGIAVVVGSVAVIEWLGRNLLDRTSIPEGWKNIIIAFLESMIVLCGYILLYKSYEKRKIEELAEHAFGRYSVMGFLTGLALQSLFILVIYLGHGYTIQAVNPLSAYLSTLASAFTAGFVAEIIFTGIIFRLLEEALGSWIALACMFILFLIAHLNAPDATVISVLATAVQSGLMLCAGYMMTRSLWFVIFLHFAWDFAEPGIFGGINPGIHGGSLFSSTIAGPKLLTGGTLGPQNSLQALLICVLATTLFLWGASKRNRFVRWFKR